MIPELCNKLVEALLRACEKSKAKHSGEQFYSVALFTCNELSYFCDSFATQEGLTKVAQEYVERAKLNGKSSNLHDEIRDLRWSPCDSPYHVEFHEDFKHAEILVNELWDEIDHDDEAAYHDMHRAVYETALAAVQKVRDADLFDANQVVFNVLIGDQSDEERYLNAEMINMPASLARYRYELKPNETTLAVLRKNRWNCDCE